MRPEAKNLPDPEVELVDAREGHVRRARAGSPDVRGVACQRAPSVCATTALDTVQFAASGSPGPLCMVLLTSTSIFGIV
jgi:hypothetical protein